MSGRGRGLSSQFKKLHVSEVPQQPPQEEVKSSEEQFAEAENVQTAQEPIVQLRRIGLGRGRGGLNREEKQTSSSETRPVTPPTKPIDEPVVETSKLKLGLGRGRPMRQLEPSSASSQQEKRPVSPPREEEQPKERISPARQLGIGRGLGRGFTKARLVSTRTEEEEPVVTSKLTSKQEEKEEAEKYKDAPVEHLEPIITAEKQELKRIPEKGPSSEPSSIAPSSNIATVTTTTAASRTQISSRAMEKASEIINVEEIARAPPVVRMGESGRKTLMLCNLIKLKTKSAGLYQYVIHFDPVVESVAMRMKFINQDLKDFFGGGKLFDGMHLYSSKLLDNTVQQVKRPTDNQDIKVKITLVKIYPTEKIPLQIFNVIFKRIMNELKFKRISDNYYDPTKSKPVENYKMEVWPGFITSVNECEDGLYLLCDVSHKVIRSSTAYDVICDISKKYGSNRREFEEQVAKELIGCVVLTRYNNRTYRIDDIQWNENPKCTFKFHGTNTDISYIEYYKKQHNIHISDDRQPLLICNDSRNKRVRGSDRQQQPQTVVRMLCLIPELCCLTGLTDQLRSDFRVMKELSAHTRVTPTERTFNLNDFLQKIRDTPQAYQHLKEWGLELDDNGLAEIDGRVLDRERIYVDKQEAFSAGDQCDWSRDISRKPVLSAVDLSDWIIVFTKNKTKEAENFCEAVYKCSRLFGIDVQDPYPLEISDDKSETYIRELKKNIQSNTQIVVIIFPTSRDDRYAAIKRLCCIEIPVASQVIIAKTISDERKLNSVAQKILLQMNCKLGGELWKLQIPINKLMIIGIDTYHQTTRQYKSLAGLVASMNNEQTRWFSKVSFQMTGQELVDSMKAAFTEALHKYYDLNGFLPDRIIIYRDGVSDSQLSYVISHEIEQFKTCFIENYKPKLSMVVVQKRINQRIFTKSASSKEPYVNPEPGSIVDNKITRHDQYDFYLVSQHVKQGTVTPTHYIVAYDDSSLKPDHMQRLTYKMTHMYYNWPGTIRVPAPCQYAHKLAFLTGQHLQREPSNKLSNRLFYL